MAKQVRQKAAYFDDLVEDAREFGESRLQFMIKTGELFEFVCKKLPKDNDELSK